MVSARVPSQSNISPRMIMGSGWQSLESLLHFVSHERFDQGVHVAFDEVLKIVEGQVDAMVGHAVLGEIVGANLLAPFAGADLRPALVVIAGLLLRGLGLQEAGAEDGQGPGLILLLRP